MCSPGDESFRRDLNEADEQSPLKSPPSIALAMKALQNKIKSLESENEQLNNTICNLRSEPAKQSISHVKNLELEIIELRQKSFYEVQRFNAEKAELKKVLFISDCSHPE